MAKKNPGGETGAQNFHNCRSECSGWAGNIVASQAQFLMTAHLVRPELAVALSAFVFGGGAHG
ncbi:MAG: hypothetical protein RL339_1825 [Pseudomonadota bacterium]|jgi:hypothetical protein